jgi:hypothetical protein
MVMAKRMTSLHLGKQSEERRWQRAPLVVNLKDNYANVGWANTLNLKR